MMKECPSQLSAQSCRQGWWDCIAYLSVLVLHAADETIPVGESLGSGAFSDRDDAVLFRVEDLANLAHGLWVSGGCGEVAPPVKPSK